MIDGYTTWEENRDQYLAALTPLERAEYDAALAAAGKRMHLAEMVYNARVEAGLSQEELARRIGTRQSSISAIERGSRAPGGVMLESIAEALGLTLSLVAH